MKRNSLLHNLLVTCLIGVCYSLNETELHEIKMNNYFPNEVHSFNRIVSKVTLNTIFPRFSPNFTTELEYVDSSATPDFNFTITHSNSEILLLTSFERPARLKINLNLNTYYLGYHFNKQVTVDYSIKKLPYEVSFIVEFEVKNSTLEQVLKSESVVLKYFKTNLWVRDTFFSTQENHRIELVAIRPTEEGRFMFTLGSYISPPPKLWNFFTMKTQNVNNCESINWSELDYFKQATGLIMDLCTLNYREISEVSKFDDNEEFVLNVKYDLTVSDPSVFFLQKLILSIIGISSLFALVSIIYLVYKITERFSNNLSSKIAYA